MNFPANELVRSILVASLSLIVAGQAHAAAPITAAAFAPGGDLVVVGSQSGIEVRSWPNLEIVRTIPTELAHVHDLKFSPDQRSLLAAGGSPAEQGGVERLRWPDGQFIERRLDHSDVVYRVAWSPSGDCWCSVGGDGICIVVSIQADVTPVRYHGHSRPVLATIFLENDRVLSGGVDATLRLWERADGRHVRTLDQHTGPINDMAVQPTAAPTPRPVVATAGEDGTVRFWQPTIGRLMRFARLPSIPRAIAWSTDGRHLFVGCSDGRVRAIDPDTTEVVGEWEAHCGRIYVLERTPSNHELLVAGEGGCRRVAVTVE